MPQEEIKPKRRSRTNWFVMLFNIAAMLALVLAYMATHVAPSTFGYFALFGLAYPFILIANLLFVVYWLLKKRRNAIYSFIVFALGWNHFTDFFQVSVGPEITEDERKVKVLTYNVHLFDLYNPKSGKETRDKIYDVLAREKADVICFQEFYHSDRKGYFPTRDTLIKFLPNKFYHERFTHALSGQQYFGVAMFSRYPMIKKGHVPFSNDPNNFCIYADLKIGDDTVRVYNAHLQSIRFRPEDYALVDGNRNKEEIEDGSKRIARRLKKAFVKREEQVNRVASSIRECPFSVILCGDFNDTPVSYTYETLTDLLDDTFIECGNGIGNTYIGVFPSFRIDYIMHSKDLEAVAYETLSEKLSDHHAVTSTLRWKKKGD